MPDTRRSDGLDVVRSVAILMVLVAHCGGTFTWWSDVRTPAYIEVWGFFGVELFFVLSGFLIGRLLIRMIGGQPGFRAWLIFLIRRWMRTLPLYGLCLAVLAVLWPPGFWEAGHGHLWGVLPWFLTLTQNLAWPMVSPWFGATWSLTIEEWFYLGFSALLLAGVTRQGPRWYWVTVLAFLIVPLMLRWNLPVSTNWDEVTRKAVIYRLDAIAFGAVVSGLEVSRSISFRNCIFMLALGLVIEAPCVGYMASISGGLSGPFPGGHIFSVVIFDIVSIGFVLFLPAAARTRTMWPIIAVPARHISQQSYCMYLIHLPLLEAFSYYRPLLAVPAPVLGLLSAGAIWVVSWLSYRWVEQPILKRRPRQIN